MSRDFTLKLYKELLVAAIKKGYTLTSYEDYIQNGNNYKKVFILRHDVDDLPENSYQTALIEKELGAKGSYYFRSVKQSFHPDIMERIRDLGHEIAYHYEDMSICKGDVDKAFLHFKLKLELFRKYYSVKTICMHGSPLSKWDNRLLWKKYNYKELGIIGEPYFDIDFKKVLYLTDTGRMWNNQTSSLRDKVESGYSFTFNSTHDIIKAFNEDKLPKQIMLNIHPQRWTDNSLLWMKEYLLQNLKNGVKKLLVKRT
ncbi:MAG TPA: hypothetical protein VF411_13375 [Bacteroidia bacterium]